MKKGVFVFVLLFAIMQISFAQETIKETVYLKNGSIIKGLVIEQIPNETLKIQTADGSIFVYKMSEVEKITKEISPVGKSSYREKSAAKKINTNRYDLHDISGYRGFVETGYTVKTGEYGRGRLDITTTHGYQFNPYLFVGGGVGLQYYHEDDLTVVPLFAEVRANFLKNKVSPFAALKVGYSVSFYDGDSEDLGFYCAPAVGVRYAVARNLALNFSVGYSLQYAEMLFYYGGYGYDTETKNVGGVSLKIGIEF